MLNKLIQTFQDIQFGGLQTGNENKADLYNTFKSLFSFNFN